MVLALIFIPLGLAVFFFGFCTLLVGFGCGDGDGCFAGVVRFCSVGVAASAQGVLQRLGISWLFGRMYALVDALLNKPNPVVQIGYLVIVCGAFEVFRRHGFPLIYSSPHMPGMENPYFTSARIVEAYGIVALALATFALACFVDPGVVTADNVLGYQALYPYDNLLFSETQGMCDTCQLAKPARSKHCRVCNRCVSKFDHHW